MPKQSEMGLNQGHQRYPPTRDLLMHLQLIREDSPGGWVVQSGTWEGLIFCAVAEAI